MKKIALVVLALISSSAMAEWRKVMDSPNAIIYMDAETMRRTGNLVRVWHLTDFQTAQSPKPNARFLSMASHNEYDCVNDTQRPISLTTYEGKMGTGKVEFSQTPNPPMPAKPLVPNTNEYELKSFVCEITKGQKAPN